MTEAHKHVADILASAAVGFLDSLSPEQRQVARFGFPDDAARRDWAYFPRNHAGLPVHDMDRRQRKLAHALFASGLSLSAYAKMTTIMGLESVLNLLEGGRADSVRDPGRYFVSVFGDPGALSWGYRIEGHHVCLNYTVVDGALVSTTSVFLGANPASVRHGDTDVARPCAEEEDLGRALLRSLDSDQRRTAVLAPTAPRTSSWRTRRLSRIRVPPASSGPCPRSWLESRWWTLATAPQWHLSVTRRKACPPVR